MAARPLVQMVMLVLLGLTTLAMAATTVRSTVGRSSSVDDGAPRRGATTRAEASAGAPAPDAEARALELEKRERALEARLRALEQREAALEAREKQQGQRKEGAGARAAADCPSAGDLGRVVEDQKRRLEAKDRELAVFRMHSRGK